MYRFLLGSVYKKLRKFLEKPGNFNIIPKNMCNNTVKEKLYLGQPSF